MSVRTWWRRNVSRRWIYDIKVIDLTGKISGDGVHFIGKWHISTDRKYMITTPSLITQKQMAILESAHSCLDYMPSTREEYKTAIQYIVIHDRMPWNDDSH